jgi:hypothetical protein
MKRLIAALTFLVVAIAFTGEAGAYTLTQRDCVEPYESNTWHYEWQETFPDGSPPETLYTLEAPCKVFLNNTFYITAMVHDRWSMSTSYFAFNWSIEDTYYALSDTTYSNPIQTVVIMRGWAIYNTYPQNYWNWIRRIPVTYTGTPYNHKIKFRFTDLGHGSGGHNSSGSIVGGITLDPIKPANSAPVVDAGPAISFASQDQNTVILRGTATDAENDPLIYRWLENNVQLLSPTPVGAGGTAPMDLSFVQPMSIGVHTLTLEASDGKLSSTDTVQVSVDNSPPTAQAMGGGTVQIATDIALNGSVSDYDADMLSYAWFVDGTPYVSGTIQPSFGGAPRALPEHVITGGLALGPHVIELVVSDGLHEVWSSIGVEVIDTIAPTLSPVSSVTMIWPPNGEMTPVSVSANAADNSGAVPSIGVTVASSEPEGDEIDYEITGVDQATGVISLLLRAERLGNAGGRIYIITVTATDQAGNSTDSIIEVRVPHDQRKK